MILVGRVVVRRDRDRRDRRRPRDPVERRREPDGAPRGVAAGSCPRWPRGPISAGSCPVLDQALGDAGVDGRRRRRGRGDPRPGPRGVAARRAELRQDARVGPRQAARRRQPSRGPPVRRLAARSRPQAAQPEEPVFPLVALIVSGGHTFLVEMRDHLTYRLLGQTVDDAAGEAFDKVGRLLGLPYPGGPAISRAAEAATRHDAAFPRAWLGDTLRLQLQRAEDGRAADDRRGPRAAKACRRAATAAARAGRPPLGRRRSPSSRGASRTPSSTCSSRRRCGRPWRRAPASIVLGGGVAANGALRTRLAGEAEARGLPLIVPRPALCTDNGAMIGAAGRAPVRGRRAGRPVARRAAVPPARAIRRPSWGAETIVAPGAAHVDPARGPPDAEGRRPAGPAQPQPELPRRPRRPRRDPRRGVARARPAGARDRAGARAADERPARRRRRW